MKTAFGLSSSTRFWPGLLDILNDGYGDHPWSAGPVHFVDGPRGVVIHGATTFPVAIARGASWDVELEERIGEAVGREARAVGANLFGGVCINLLRHPGWGRAQETYGEDPVLLGEMGAALTRGVQRHAVACAKHFALNSIENSRFKVDVRVEERPLRELYLPHFKQVVDAGVGCIMSAYNRVNGAWCGENERLLTDILKDEWGFDGFVMTDFIFGIRDAKRAILAGQDLEMPFQMHFARHLEGLVERGEVPRERVDDAAERITRTIDRLVPEGDYPRDLLACDEHRALSRESARKSIVLLKNDAGALPFEDVGSIGVFGELAAVPNLGDGGSSNTRPPHVTTPLEGLRDSDVRVEYDDGSDLLAAEELAASVDAAVVIIGLTAEHEGEYVSPDTFREVWRMLPLPGLRDLPALAQAAFRGLLQNDTGDFVPGGDRTDLRLPKDQVELIQRVAATNPRTVVVVMSGGAVTMESWRDAVPAIVQLWYPGMEGGHALTDILFGRVSPSGRLPFAIPTDASHLPAFDPDAREVEYDLWHGYRLLERDGNEPAFGFGHGLSYTTFRYDDLTAVMTDAGAHATLNVTNEGARDSDHVVLLFASAPDSDIERPARWLVAFDRVSLEGQQSKEVELFVPQDRLAYWSDDEARFVVESGGFDFSAADSHGVVSVRID